MFTDDTVENQNYLKTDKSSGKKKLSWNTNKLP